MTLLLTYLHFSFEIFVQISSKKLQRSATELNHYFWLPCITGPPRTCSKQDSNQGTGGRRTNKDIKVASAPPEATGEVRFTCTQLFTSWSQLYLHCVPLHAKVRFTLKHGDLVSNQLTFCNFENIAFANNHIHLSVVTSP